MDQQHDPTLTTQLSGRFFVIVIFWAWSGVLGNISWRAPPPSCLCSQWLCGMVCVVCGNGCHIALGDGHHIAFGWRNHTDTASGENLTSFRSSLAVNTFLWIIYPLFTINIAVIVPTLLHCFVFSENYFLNPYSLLLSLLYQKGFEGVAYLEFTFCLMFEPAQSFTQKKNIRRSAPW